MLIPTRAVLGTIEEAAKLGTKAATIYSAGFGEGEDPKGKDRAQAMKELCDRTGFVVCGPNCMGSFSLPEGLWSFPTPVPLLQKGPVGLIFQSGGSLGNWVKGRRSGALDLPTPCPAVTRSVSTLSIICRFSSTARHQGHPLMVEGIRRPGSS